MPCAEMALKYKPGECLPQTCSTLRGSSQTKFMKEGKRDNVRLRRALAPSLSVLRRQPDHIFSRSWKSSSVLLLNDLTPYHLRIQNVLIHMNMSGRSDLGKISARNSIPLGGVKLDRLNRGLSSEVRIHSSRVWTPKRETK